MEEEKKEEIKKEKPKRSTKSKVITVMLCISFFCVLSILLFVIFGRDYLPFFRNEVDNTTKEEEKKEESKKEEEKKEESKKEGNKEKENKEETTNKLTIYKYSSDDGDYQISTSEKEGYDSKFEYTCLDKPCELLNEGQSPWARNTFNYAIINDNNKAVIMDLKTKTIIKTDIVPTDKFMDNDPDKVSGPVFKYKDEDFTDLRAVESDNNHNIFIRMFYVNKEDKMLVFVYNIAKGKIVEGREYDVPNPEFSFDDEYKVVFTN